MTAPQDIHFKLYAIGQILRLCELCYKATRDGVPGLALHDTIKSMSIDHRNAMERIDNHLDQTLAEAVRPIWLDLPQSIKAICIKAGFVEE